MSDERGTSDDSTRFAAGRGADDETRFTGVGAPAPGGAPSHTTFPPGSLIGHTYRIEALLARGGMGEVYRARHIELNTEHALKIILPELANNQRIVDLFRREASVLRTIRHDAVVAYDGVSRDENGRLYLVMEFVDGPSLSKLMGKRTFTAEEVRQLRDRLADGLAVAHDKGVIHRDISPDNVILPGGDVGKAKIIDFGISKMADPEQKTIVGDDFAGKFSYVSPEQLGMFGGKVDGRSDIYSLGLVLAAAAQGEPLDMGLSPISVIEARRTVPDLSRVPAEVRGDLAAMLQPDPANRPQSMREMIRPQEGSAGRRSTRMPDRSQRPSASKPGVGRMGAILGALGILVVAGGGFGYWYWQVRNARDDTTQQATASTASTPGTDAAGTAMQQQQQAEAGTTASSGTASTDSGQASGPDSTVSTSGDQSAAAISNGTATDGTTSDQQQASSGSQSNANDQQSSSTGTTTPTDGATTTTAAQTTDAAASNATGSGASAGGTTATDVQSALLPQVPDVAKLRRDAEQAVEGATCAGVRVDVSDSGDIRASGYVASPAARDEAVARLATLPDVGRVDNAVVVMARPLCDVLDVLRAHTTFDRGLPVLGVAAVYRQGDAVQATATTVYREGDHIQVTVTAPPGFDGYLYVDYIDAAEGYVIHLLPNGNFRPDNRVTGGQQIVIGSLREEYDAYKIQPPFGANLIVAVASREPLFRDMREIQESVDQYLPALRSSLAAQGGADSASQYVGVLLQAR
jgi:serine/threonine protein kinase